jgi:predicted ester cyclase
MVVNRDQLQDFAARYTAAWCSGQPEQVAAHYSPDGSLKINDADPLVGRAAIADSHREVMSAFPDLQVAMDDLVVEGDRIEYHWTVTGTNSGPSGTGNAVRVSGFEHWTIGEDGLIASSVGHSDEEEWNRQIAHGAGSN